jgi:hypothetical protein
MNFLKVFLPLLLLSFSVVMPASAEQQVVLQLCRNALFGNCLNLKVDPRLVNEVIYIKEGALLFFYPLLGGEKGVELVSWKGQPPTHFNNGVRLIPITRR